MDNGKLRYDSDLTDEEWAVLAPLVPVGGKGGRPLTYHKRDIVEAILYVVVAEKAAYFVTFKQRLP